MVCGNIIRRAICLKSEQTLKPISLSLSRVLASISSLEKRILTSKDSAKVIHYQHIVWYCDQAECLVCSINRRGNIYNLLILKKTKNMYLRFLTQTIKLSKSFGNFDLADTQPYWYGDVHSIVQDMMLYNFASSLIP